MHDAALVRRIERVGDLPGDRQRLGDSACARRVSRDTVDDVASVVSLDELEDERVNARRASSSPWIVAMLGWLSDGKRARLALEARQPIGIGPKRGRQDLQRDVAAELASRARDRPRPSRRRRGGMVIRYGPS